MGKNPSKKYVIGKEIGYLKYSKGKKFTVKNIPQKKCYSQILPAKKYPIGRKIAVENIHLKKLFQSKKYHLPIIFLIKNIFF